MSAGDYIALKKSKLLKNYGVPTATANKSPYVHTSYDHYIHNVALIEATTACSRLRNGTAVPATVNGILIGRTGTCPVNTYDGPTIVRKTDIATNAAITKNAKRTNRLTLNSSQDSSFADQKKCQLDRFSESCIQKTNRKNQIQSVLVHRPCNKNSR